MNRNLGQKGHSPGARTTMGAGRKAERLNKDLGRWKLFLNGPFEFTFHQPTVIRILQHDQRALGVVQALFQLFQGKTDLLCLISDDSHLLNPIGCRAYNGFHMEHISKKSAGL